MEVGGRRVEVLAMTKYDPSVEAQLRLNTNPSRGWAVCEP